MVMILPVLLAAQAEKKQDVWEPMKFLVGQWEGKGEGKSGISKVSHDFEFIMKGRYLHMRTKATFEPQEKNPKGEVHEDWGFFSSKFPIHFYSGGNQDKKIALAYT